MRKQSDWHMVTTKKENEQITLLKAEIEHLKSRIEHYKASTTHHHTQLEQLKLKYKTRMRELESGDSSNLMFGIEKKWCHIKTDVFQGCVFIEKETPFHIVYSYKDRVFGVLKRRVESWIPDQGKNELDKTNL